MKPPARFALVLCLFLALAACTGNTATSTPSATPLPPTASPLPTAAETPTAAAPPSPGPTGTAKNTPIPATPTEALKQPSQTSVTGPAVSTIAFDCRSYYNLLHPGEYILYYVPPTYFVISPDNGFTAKFAEGGQCNPANNRWSGVISQDGKYLAYAKDEATFTKIDGTTVVIYDLSQDVQLKQVQIAWECFRFAWSPDNRYLAASCFTGQSSDLFVIPIDGQEPILLTTWEKEWNTPNAIENPQWSPDGHWISFHFDHQSGSTKPKGYYLIDTVCLLSPSTCIEKMTPLPFYPEHWPGPADYAWSSDGRYLAQEDSGISIKFALWDTQLFQEKMIDFGQNIDVPGVQAHAWSPDNQWVARYWCKKDNTPNICYIMLMPVNGGEPVLLDLEPDNYGGVIIDWLTILPPFAPGLELSVSLAGHDLNLRAEPSLDGAMLRKLAPGTRLTILEGPVEADGYTWWKMQTEDGSEGWAVEVGVWYQPVGGE